MSTKPPDALLDSETSFSSPPYSTLLDPRILRSLADLKFAHPTLVQAKAIPLLLDGKDVLAKARTGSGKTGAYGVPMVQRILSAKETTGITSPDYQTTRGVILVPTKELALQVTAFIKSITSYCEGIISVVNVASGGNSQRVQLSDKPDILISTPSRLLTLLQAKTVDLSSLCSLTIDEADLLLSYGHKDDLTRIMDPAMGWVPRLGVQGCLMSATLSEDVEGVKGLILRNPAILTLSEPTSSILLSQHFTHTTERDKFLLIYVLLKLKLIRGKSIIFVNDVERGYRVKLFLEQFGIKCCVVNSELPLSSRYHVVEEFNRGVYDVVVASDEGLGGEASETEPEAEVEAEGGAKGEGNAEGGLQGMLIAGTVEPAEEEEEEEEDEDKVDADDVEAEAGPSTSKSSSKDTKNKSSKRRATSPDKAIPAQTHVSRKRRREDPTSSFARGIDFTSASTVINFDLPLSPTAYMHRVGRTARAGQSGLSLSFVVPKASWGKNHTDRSISLKSAQFDEKVFERIRDKVREGGGGEIKEWDWGGRKSEIEGFRYRMEDALRSVTAKRVADARREEVKRELLNSEKLKAHFAANPLDLAYLRHDNPLHPARVQPHLKHVPNYLMPKMGGMKLDGQGDVGDGANVGFRGRGRGRGGLGGGGRGGRGRGRGGKKVDVLKFKG